MDQEKIKLLIIYGYSLALIDRCSDEVLEDMWFQCYQKEHGRTPYKKIKSGKRKYDWTINTLSPSA
jgi:hypothetical protein